MRKLWDIAELAKVCQERTFLIRQRNEGIHRAAEQVNFANFARTGFSEFRC